MAKGDVEVAPQGDSWTVKVEGEATPRSAHERKSDAVEGVLREEPGRPDRREGLLRERPAQRARLTVLYLAPWLRHKCRQVDELAAPKRAWPDRRRARVRHCTTRSGTAFDGLNRRVMTDAWHLRTRLGSATGAQPWH